MSYRTIDNMKSNIQKAAKQAANTRNFAKRLSLKRNQRANITPTYSARVKTPEVTNSNGYTGVRAAMNNMGMDNSKIGWDNGYVTYRDMKFKPAAVENDTSYAPKKDVQNFVNEIYKTEGKNPVRITDYAAPAGMGGISYSNNGEVSVGGKNIPILYMDGDRAVVDSNDLDRAYDDLKNSMGISTADELRKNWDRKYKSRLKNAYEGLSDYGNWSYNPEQDPAYRAYSEMYKREADRAYRDAAAKMASKNNGNMTSAAQSLANQQLSYYMSRLADRIPELEKDAYERYKNGYDMNRQTYEALRAEADAAWNREVEANKTAKDDYAKWLENERQRTLNNQNDTLTDLRIEADRLGNEGKIISNEGGRISNQGALINNETAKIKQEGESIKNEQARYDNAWANAERRGRFTEPEAELWSIPQNENGGYITPNDIRIMLDRQYFNEYTKEELDYKTEKELEKILRQLEAKRFNDEEKARLKLSLDKSLAAYKAGLKK